MFAELDGRSHSSQSQVDKSFELSQPEPGPSKLSEPSVSLDLLPSGYVPTRMMIDQLAISCRRSFQTTARYYPAIGVPRTISQ